MNVWQAMIRRLAFALCFPLFVLAASGCDSGGASGVSAGNPSTEDASANLPDAASDDATQGFDAGCVNGPCTDGSVSTDAQADGKSDAPDGNDCEGVICQTPPAATCATASTLRTYEPQGTCSAHTCRYQEKLVNCPGAGGCANGTCMADPCTGVTCNAPPAATCIDANNLRTYSGAGSCSGGTCSYAPTVTMCPFGCANAACNGDPCAGVSCSRPPATYCVDANTQRSFANPGTCAGGGCSYAPMNATCAFGCENGRCNNDPCVGVSCRTPPPASCQDANTLRTFAASGTCAGGSCTYAQTLTNCQYGCQNGACRFDPCSNVSCTTPPSSTCQDSTTLRSFASRGSCSGGSCSYAPTLTTCPYGCQNGGCLADPCTGISCSTPPAAACQSATTLRSFAPNGTCSAGSCSYSSTLATCPFGCANGACQTDACANVSCHTPPARTCVNGNTARVYNAAGTCVAGGTCSYTYTDQACANGCSAGTCNGPSCGGSSCNTPPASACQDARRLRTWARLGTCNASTQCNYQEIAIDCSEGCFNGGCVSGSWMTEKNTLLVDADNRQMAVDPSANPHLVICRRGDVIHRFRNDYGWLEELIDPGMGSSTCFASIVIDASGNPAVSYYDGVNKDLRFARRIDGVWQKELVVTAGDVGNGSSLTFDSSNQPFIAYFEGSLVKVARKLPAGWVTETAIPISQSGDYRLWNDVGMATEMRFDPSGQLHIVAGTLKSFAVPSGSYSQPSVVHAVKEANSWRVDKVTDEGVMSRRSLGFDASGVARIVHGVVTRNNAADQINFVTFPSGSIASETILAVDNLSYRGLSARNDSPLPPLVMNRDADIHWREQINGYWPEAATPPPQGWGVDDVSTKPDGRSRFLLVNGDLLTPPVCTPRCSGRSCGDDGCGGTCGSCAAGSCTPRGICTAWTLETVTKSPPNYGTLGLQMASSGLVHAAVFGGTAKTFEYVRNSSGWGTPVPIGDAFNADMRSFVLLPSGDPALAYVNLSSSARRPLGVATSQAGAWTLNPSGFISQDGPPSVAVDASGTMHMATGDYASGSGYALRYSTFQNGVFNSSVVTTSAVSIGGVSLALDPLGKAHILWIAGQNGTYSLRYSNNTSGTWAHETLRTSFPSQYYVTPRILIDGNGGIHATWYEGSSNVYARRIGTSWTVEPFPTAYRTSYAEMFLDPTGVPWFVVLEGNNVNVASRAGAGNWPVDLIPTFTFMSSNKPVLAFDAQRKPVVLYWDDAQLRYGKK